MCILVVFSSLYVNCSQRLIYVAPKALFSIRLPFYTNKNFSVTVWKIKKAIENEVVKPVELVEPVESMEPVKPMEPVEETKDQINVFPN